MNNQLITPIIQRFSPLIFSDKKVTQEQLDTLILAASWSASAFNHQPWKFLYEFRETEGFEILHSLLTDYNKQWTEHAPILMLGLARHLDEKGRENYHAMYDLGQAVSAMAIQASAMGMQIHQMGGYDMKKATEILHIPSEYVPGAMIALGFPGDVSLLEEPFLGRATAERTRKSLNEISGNTKLFAGG